MKIKIILNFILLFFLFFFNLLNSQIKTIFMNYDILLDNANKNICINDCNNLKIKIDNICFNFDNIDNGEILNNNILIIKLKIKNNDFFCITDIKNNQFNFYLKKDDYENICANLNNNSSNIKIKNLSSSSIDSDNLFFYDEIIYNNKKYYGLYTSRNVFIGDNEKVYITDNEMEIEDKINNDDVESNNNVNMMNNNNDDNENIIDNYINNIVKFNECINNINTDINNTNKEKLKIKEIILEGINYDNITEYLKYVYDNQSFIFKEKYYKVNNVKLSSKDFIKYLNMIIYFNSEDSYPLNDFVGGQVIIPICGENKRWYFIGEINDNNIIIDINEFFSDNKLNNNLLNLLNNKFNDIKEKFNFDSNRELNFNFNNIKIDLNDNKFIQFKINQFDNEILEIESINSDNNKIIFNFDNDNKCFRIEE